VPITPHLKGRTFDPATIKVMGIAFEKACATLNLEKYRMERVLVAEAVIAHARHGITDADKLAWLAAKEVKGYGR